MSSTIALIALIVACLAVAAGFLVGFAFMVEKHAGPRTPDSAPKDPESPPED